MKYYLAVIKKYAQFTGRSNRPEYWYFVLFNLIFAIAAAVVDNILGFNFAPLPYGIIYVLYGLFVFLPGLGAAVRRLHDINKSGWYILVALIPIAGAIWLIVLLATKGTPGENRFGPDPSGEMTFDFEAQKA